MRCVVVHDLRHTLKHISSQPTDCTEQAETCHTLLLKVRRAAFRIEDPCLSVGSHSAAACTVLFDHSGTYPEHAALSHTVHLYVPTIHKTNTEISLNITTKLCGQCNEYRLLLARERGDGILLCTGLRSNKLSVEQCWNDNDGEEPKYSGKSLFQWYFAHHISHRDWSEVKPWILR